ncbi:hypothetical protein NQ176_g10741 [Zarea fungicola]|uniref:Uncharacterized protein n=1 Tax=Zarea fungicola TaxID=93591 RepID=A0ACC1MFQ5_9HYPO|nr:hypothetical protein NQ176_g10741 [Lecanicillium fungicola]
MPVTFHVFSMLPAELRSQIWNDAIPVDGPAVFTYRDPESCTMTNTVGYDEEFSDKVIEFDHFYNLFTRIYCLDGLQSANRESRAAVLAWLDKQGTVERRPYPGKAGSFHLRPVRAFNPQLDALYVPRHRMHAFAMQFFDFMFEPQNLETSIRATRAHVQKLIVPRSAFDNGDHELLTEVTEYFDDVTVIYVAVVEHDELEGQDEMATPTDYPETRWEMREHSLSESEASEMKSRITANFEEMQRGSAAHQPALLYLKRVGRLPWDIELADVAEVTSKN